MSKDLRDQALAALRANWSTGTLTDRAGSGRQVPTCAESRPLSMSLIIKVAVVATVQTSLGTRLTLLVLGHVALNMSQQYKIWSFNCKIPS